MHNTDKIPTGWAKAKISDLFDFIGGGTPSKKELRFWNGEIPWASVKDIKGNYLTSTQDTITEIGLANSAANIANPGEVILITRISPGKVITTKIKTAINQDLKIVRPKYDANPDFVRYLFNTLEKECIKLSSGTTVLGITLDVLNDIHIIIPPLNEQNRIVDKLDELLSELEKGKEQLQTSLEQLKVYRNSLLNKLFFEDRNDQITYRRIGDFTNIISGHAFKKNEYSKSGVKLFQIANVSFNKTDWSKTAYLPKDYLDKQEYKKLKLQKGDIVMALNRPLLNRKLKVAELSSNDIPSILYQRVGKFEFLDHQLYPKYLLYFFQTPKFIDWLESQLKGVNIPFINQSKLLNYNSFPYIEASIQIQKVDIIENKFSIVDQLDVTLVKSINEIENLKTSLLSLALEGKLVEQDPTDEPASVLLERIKKEREEYLKAEKERKKTEKPLYIKSRKMAEELKRIMEILKESKEPVSAKTLWQSSTHKDNIDDFYAALKKHIEAGEIVELPRKGKESFLKLADAK